MPKTYNKTGRSKGGVRFFAVQHFVVKSPAFNRLSANAQAAWLRVGMLYDGKNNGYLAMSFRQLGVMLNVSKTSAAWALNELVTAGLLEKTKASDFSKKRLAAQYRMTHLKCNLTGNSASKTFMLLIGSRQTPSSARETIRLNS
jgi:hypothetical protein